MAHLLSCIAAFIATQGCVVIASQMKCDRGFVRANATSDECAPCPPGTYMSERNREFRCHDCTRCSQWPVTISECNATHDRLCGCYDGYYKEFDGCVKSTAHPNPLSNCTASVERIELFLVDLQNSFNDTHGKMISEISFELGKLKRTLAIGLNHLEKLTIQQAQSANSRMINVTTNIANMHQLENLTLFLKDQLIMYLQECTLVSAMNQTHETIIGTQKSAIELLHATLALLCIVIITMVVCAFGREKIRRMEMTSPSLNYTRTASPPSDTARRREDFNSPAENLLDLVSKLENLATGTDLHEKVKQLRDTIFAEKYELATETTIHSLIDDIIAAGPPSDTARKREGAIKDTGEKIMKIIFGEENEIGQSINTIFKYARKTFRSTLQLKAEKIKTKIDRLEASQRESQIQKIKHSLTKLAGCSDVKVFEVTMQLKRRLGGHFPDCEIVRESDLQILTKVTRPVRELLEAANQTKASLTSGSRSAENEGHGYNEWKSMSVRMLVSKLTECTTGTPYRGITVVLGGHFFGERPLQHMVSSLMFSDQQKEIFIRQLRIDKMMLSMQAAINEAARKQKFVQENLDIILQQRNLEIISYAIQQDTDAAQADKEVMSRYHLEAKA